MSEDKMSCFHLDHPGKGIQSIHIAQVTVTAQDPPFEGGSPVTGSQNIRIVVGLQHQDPASGHPVKCQSIHMSQVCGDSYFAAVRKGKGKADRIQSIVGQRKSLHGHSAERKGLSRDKKSPPGRQQIPPHTSLTDSTGHIGTDPVTVCKDPASFGVIRMFMGDEDSTDSAGIDLPCQHPFFQFPGTEPGIQQQQTAGGMNHTGIAGTAAAEYRNTEIFHFFYNYPQYKVVFSLLKGYYNPQSFFCKEEKSKKSEKITFFPPSGKKKRWKRLYFMAGTLETNLSHTQGQNQELNQQLSSRQLHALKILQSPRGELLETLREEVNMNPLLELAEPDRTEEAALLADAPEKENFREEELDEQLARLAESPDDWMEYAEYPQEREAGGEGEVIEEAREYFFDHLVSEKSLAEELTEELSALDFPSPDHRKAAGYIVDMLDEKGFFTEDIGESASFLKLPVSTVEEALAIVQKLEPRGIGARDLTECLLLQIDRKKEKELACLIEKHLPLIARNRLPQVAEKMRITMPELQKLLEKLRHLDYAPGKTADNRKTLSVEPDVIVTEGEDGEYNVISNEKEMPCLRIIPRYLKLLEDPGLSREDRNYMKEKLNEGNLAIHELEQRKSTVLRIAILIVSEQYEFFRKGEESLRPLTMRQAADKLGIHETTVSRAVANKYMKTPRGLFEFRFFFSTGFRSETGEEASSKAVKEMISALIAEEDPEKPLSDEKLSKLLKEKGFTVARRTVMKYREAMGIASSQMRKSYT